MFHVGQRVVCVDASRTNSWNEPELIEGAIYHIRWAGDYTHSFWHKTAYCVRLDEIAREEHPIWIMFNDCPFRADRFRPVVERNTDISIFTELLKQEPTRTPELCGND